MHGQLNDAGLELIQCAEIKNKRSFSLSRSPGVKTRDLVQLFLHLDQMQAAGVPLLDAMSDIRDTTDNDKLRDILSDIYRNITEGASMSEAMAMHPRVFGNIYLSLIKAGETTGDLNFAYKQIIKYLEWLDNLQRKMKKATRYPMVLLAVVVLVVVVMLGYVVPQIIGFIENLDQELPFYTVALMNTSDVFQSYGIHMIIVPIVAIIFYKLLRKSSNEFAYRADSLFLKMPIMGPLLKKITIARYCQTFAALYSAGISVLGCLEVFT